MYLAPDPRYPAIIILLKSRVVKTNNNNYWFKSFGLNHVYFLNLKTIFINDF